MQLSLFSNEVNWNNITTEWLFDYFNKNYPELKFKLGNKWSYANPNEEMIQEVKPIITETKRVICNIYISTVNIKEYTWWNSPILVHFDIYKTGGDYHGKGWAVDNMEDFKKGVFEIIKTFNEWTKN